ncbi:MAG: efflux RND transporter permease subunit [Limisphaerales bacterium]
MRDRLHREFPGTLFYFLPADIVSQTLNFSLPAPFDIQIVGRDQVKNRELAVQLAEQIKKIPGAVDVRVQQPNDLPQFSISVDRFKAAELGLTVQNVASSVLLGLSGSSQVQPAYWLNPNVGVQYLINVRAPEYAMDSIQQLNAMPISVNRGNGGNAQILANLATLTRLNVPPVVSITT